MTRWLRIIVFCLLSMPKSLIFNFRMLPLKEALKFPFLVGYNVQLLELHKGMIELRGKIKPGMVLIGYGGSRGIPYGKSSLCFEKGKVIFCGKAQFALGVSIRVNGKLEIGENFAANRNLFISCSDSIVFGNDLLFGWNCSVRDSDGHTVIYKGTEKSSHAPVFIDDHVWVCSESSILKGIRIGKDSVVAYGSVVTKDVAANTLIGGNPAKLISDDISWKY